MKVAINSCYGGFNLSPAAFITLAAHKGITVVQTNRSTRHFPSYATLLGEPIYESHLYSSRTDPDLIAVIEQLGTKASGSCANLRVIDIPDDVKWELEDYDGYESIHEVHRSWS